MTTKQIAAAVGKDETAVRRWTRKLAAKSPAIAVKIAASSPMKPADYDLDEAVAIIETGLGRNAAGIYRENAQRSAAGTFVAPESIAAIVRDTVTALVPLLIAAVRGALPDQAVTVLPPPAPLPARAELRQVIAGYAARSHGGDHRSAWNTLYSQYYYRYRTNLRERALNRGIDTLDYAEEDGHLPQLISLAAALAAGR
jgi:hypothetical protein